MAGHIAGGEIFYKYLGKGSTPNSSKYRITMRLFKETNAISNSGQKLADLPTDLYIGIYKNTNPTVQFGDLVHVFRTGNPDTLTLKTYNPCLKDKIPVSYVLAVYDFDQELPDIPEGYVIGYQTCCRSFSVVNVEFFPVPSGSNTINAEGATYSCEIPGTNILGT
jgi:hypothetical protein